MTSLSLKVDEHLCFGCGACVSDCPEKVLVLNEDSFPAVSPERASLCIACQHCLAVCPAGALSVFGLDPNDSLKLSENSFPPPESIKAFVRGRRSCRQFKPENVPRALTDSLLDDLAYVPTGCNIRKLKFLAVGETEAMSALRKLIFAKVLEAAADPAKTAAQPALAFLKGAVEEYNAGGRDVIFRGTPHLLVIAAPSSHPCAPQDTALTLAYFEFLAVTAGLGVCWCGFLEMLDKCVPEVRRILGIDRTDAMYAMMYGWPDVRYARTVQRSGTASVRRLTKEDLDGSRS